MIAKTAYNPFSRNNPREWELKKITFFFSFLELKEKEVKLKKYEQQLKKEDFLANSLHVWNNEILKNWNEL